MKTKAQVEVQFNWIFIMLVGVVLVIFFVNIVNNQRQTAEASLSSDVLSNLNNIISGVAVSENKLYSLDIPDVPIGLECTEECACSIKVQAKGVTDIAIRTNPAFSPNLIKGLKIEAWSKAFNVPFRATNFFYMTSPQVKYLIESTDSGLSLYDSLPNKKDETTGLPQFTKELFSNNQANLSKLENTNNYKVKFVFFSDPTSVPQSLVIMSDADVSAIKINENDRSITFYQKNGNRFTSTGTTKYIESASLFGAVLSENIQAYNCMMEQALATMNVVAQTYKARAVILRNTYTDNNDSDCAVWYDTTFFDNLIQPINGGFKGLNDQALRSLTDSVQSLSSQNQGATLQTCAPLY